MKYLSEIRENNIHKKIVLSLHISLLLPCCCTLNAKQLEFLGNTLKVQEIQAERNTGLDYIYVAYNTDGISAKIKSDNPANVRWYKYSNLGGAFAEELYNVNNDSEYSILSKLDGDMGYIVEDGTDRYYFWIVDYGSHRFMVNSITPAVQQDCDYTSVNVDGDGDPIHYFTINGQQRVLSREIYIFYDTEEWNSDTKSFERKEMSKVLESLTPTLSLPPAYCSTFFTIEGDRFLREWNWLQTKESSVMSPYSVAVNAQAVQINTNDDESNIIRSEGSDLGGSAPAEISFTAYTTQGVMHDEWQMSRSSEFEDIEYRFSVREFDYNFTEEGTFYLRYIGSNEDGSCESVSDTFTIVIGKSDLKCPNAFSPDDDGVNDEWKVSYRSIIDFKCWIFDRNGQQMAYLDSPDKGWDGKHNGRKVRSGVYYYVIQATGADGRKYKKSGDINILLHKRSSGAITPSK